MWWPLLVYKFSVTLKILWFLVTMNLWLPISVKMCYLLIKWCPLAKKYWQYLYFKFSARKTLEIVKKIFWFAKKSYHRNTDWYHFLREKLIKNEQYYFSWKQYPDSILFLSQDYYSIALINWHFCHNVQRFFMI